MRSLIFSNLTTRKPAVDAAGASLTLPVLVAGQQWTTALRFTERVEGTYGEVFPDIHSLRASIGLVDARPVTSTWKLQVGSGASTGANTTVVLDREIAPSDLAKALNDLSGITPHDFSVEWDNGSYIVRRASGAQFVLTPRANRLRPVSFVRLREFQQDGEYAFDVRLVRAPLAFTDTAEPMLPAEPYIVTVVDGNTDASGTYFVNEVQNLILPPDFRGVYYLRRGLLRTSLLSTDDGAEEIKTALDAMLEPEGGTVAVTNPQTGTARIEFKGDLSGVNLDPLTVQVTVEGTPPGDWTFTLDLNRSEMWAALRETETVKAVYELEAKVYIDPEDHDAGTRTVKLWKEPVQVTRPVQFEGLAAAQNIDWLRPPSPKTYVPFTLSQVLTGQQQAFVEPAIGDGSATSFTLDHNFSTGVCQVIVIENATGRVLRDNEYTVHLVDGDLTVSGFATVPAAGQYTVAVVAVGPESVFQAHTHTIEQILTLQDTLDDFAVRLGDLEALIPRRGTAGAVSGANIVTFTLPDYGEVLADVSALGEDTTLASQIISGDAGYKSPVGTELAEEVERKKVEEEKAKGDPEALPANVLYRVSIPGIGRVGSTGAAAQTDASGSIIVPEIDAVEANPAVWPVRSNPRVWPLLLPAVTDASVTTVSTLPSVPSSPGVYQNTGTDPLAIPGGSGRRGQTVPVNGFFASDTRAWYRVEREGATNLYHPQEMERELWRALIGDEQFPEGATLSISGEIRTRMVGEFFDDDARAIPRVDLGGQYLLKCEAVPVAGTVSLGAASTAVLLGQTRVTLSPNLESFRWELKITRTATAMVSSWLAYRKATAGATFALPAALRLRLAGFDVDDASANPRGQIALTMPATTLEIKL